MISEGSASTTLQTMGSPSSRGPQKEGCGTKHNVRTWCNQDPCGVVCAGVTWWLILYAQYAVNKVVIFDWMGLLSLTGLMNFVGFNATACLAMLSHIRAMITDPGAVPREALPLPDDEGLLENGTAGGVSSSALEEGKHPLPSDGGAGVGPRQRVRKFCRRCNAFKPARAHHCSICRRCIIKMDHHCPWVNNCVGIGNHKLFLLFIFYIFLMCTYALVLVVVRYAKCMGEEEPAASEGCDDVTGNLLVVFLVIEAILFGLFTCCMMLDQWTVVSTNTTAIDRLKMGAAAGGFQALQHQQQQQKKGGKGDVNEVFGGREGRRVRWHWFWPVPAHFPGTTKNDVLGYRVEGEEKDVGEGGGKGEGGEECREADEETGIMLLDRRRRSSSEGVGVVVKEEQLRSDGMGGREGRRSSSIGGLAPVPSKRTPTQASKGLGGGGGGGGGELSSSASAGVGDRTALLRGGGSV